MFISKINLANLLPVNYIRYSNVLMYPSSKENNHRHLNKDVGMGKLPEINKRRAYFYSELKSTFLRHWRG